MNILKTTAKTGAIIAVSAMAYFAAEKSGLSDWMKNYQRAEAEVTKEYASQTLGTLQENLASSKYMSGMAALFAGSLTTYGLFRKKE